MLHLPSRSFFCLFLYIRCGLDVADVKRPHVLRDVEAPVVNRDARVARTVVAVVEAPVAALDPPHHSRWCLCRSVRVTAGSHDFALLVFSAIME